MFRLVRTPRYCMVNSPLPYALEISAGMRRAVVRPWITIVIRIVETEHPDVALAHDELPQRIDAMVQMPPQVHQWRRSITSERSIVVFIHVLSQQVETVELVKDLDSHAISRFSAARIRNLQRGTRVEP